MSQIDLMSEVNRLRAVLRNIYDVAETGRRMYFYIEGPSSEFEDIRQLAHDALATKIDFPDTVTVP